MRESIVHYLVLCLKPPLSLVNCNLHYNIIERKEKITQNKVLKTLDNLRHLFEETEKQAL